jgi:uncharacterized membrane protein
VLPILALFIVVLVLATSLAVDIGRLSNRNRDLQNISDMVSLVEVRAIGTDNSAALAVSGSSFLQTVQDSAANNGFPVSCTTSTTQPNYEANCTSTEASSRDSLTVDLGLWCTAEEVTDTSSPCDGAVIPSGKPGVLVYDTSGNNIPTAVQVTTGDFVKYYFGLGIVNGQSATRSGTASQGSPWAGFQMGSFLLASNPNTGMLGILNELAGTNLAVDSWSGLASANMSLANLVDIGDLGAGSPQALLQGSVKGVDLLNAMAAVLTHQEDQPGAPTSLAAAIAGIEAIKAKMDPDATIPIADLITAGVGGEQAAAEAQLSALQLVTGSLWLINGSQFVNAPSLDLQIPGVAAATARVKVIQQPQFAFGPEGTQLHTSQTNIETHLAVNLDVAVSGLPLLSVSGDLPVTVAAGSATGTLQIDCTRPGIGVDVGSNTVSTQVGPTTLTVAALGLPVATVTIGSAAASPAGSGGTPTFAYTSEFLPQVGTGTTKRAGATTLGLDGSLTTSNSSISILGGILGLKVPLGPILSALDSSVLGPLDSQVIQPLASVLGLDLGGADVGALDMLPDCSGSPILVQ